MALTDIRETVPPNIGANLLTGEEVYFYGTGGGGCVGGGSSYIVVSDSRILGTALEEAGGCLGFLSIFTSGSAKRQVSVAIPLEHVSSVRTKSGGCLSGAEGVTVSSGTAESSFSTKNSQQAAAIIQEAMRASKKK